MAQRPWSSFARQNPRFRRKKQRKEGNGIFAPQRQKPIFSSKAHKEGKEEKKGVNEMKLEALEVLMLTDRVRNEDTK